MMRLVRRKDVTMEGGGFYMFNCMANCDCAQELWRGEKVVTWEGAWIE